MANEITVYRRAHSDDDLGSFWTDSRAHAESLPSEVFGDVILTATIDLEYADVMTVENADELPHDIGELSEEYPDIDVIVGPCDAGAYGNTTYILVTDFVDVEID
jgi:hypothetical protein